MTRTPGILLVLVPVLLLATGCGRAPDQPLPAVTVTASYPGANAAVVADTVAAPIEQQVIGVEGLVRMASRSGNDGTYTLTVTFKRGTDLNLAQVLVQNRIALAAPVLPAAVNQRGQAVLKNSPGVLLFVNLYSLDGRLDVPYLGNDAALQLKYDLNRVPGVLDVVVFGRRDITLRVWLDPDKLAARNLTAADVVEALKAQNLQPAADQAGQPPPGGDRPLVVAANTPGRPPDPEKLAEVAVKTDDKGQTIRLKDVGWVELGTSRGSRVRLDTRPGVALAIGPTDQARPRDVSAAVLKRLAELKGHFPEGLDYAVAFDFTANWENPGRATTPEYLLLDITLPASASLERTDAVLKHCEQLLRETAGVQHTLALSDNPFDRVPNRPCLLVGLAAADGKGTSREQIVQGLRTRLGKEVPEALVRLRDLSGPSRFPRCGYPIDLAVSGPEADQVQKLAKKLAERLGREQQLTDVLASAESMASWPQLYLDIDYTRAKERGVALQDILHTLQAAFGAVEVFNVDERPVDLFTTDQRDRIRRVQVRADGNSRDRVGDLKQFKVRNNKGDMVPLGDLAAVRESMGPLVIDRLNLRPAVEITANPASGVSLDQARTLCETAAEAVRKELGLSAEYRLTWLEEPPAAK
jgi:multidrug efflux pump subunit AcrB